jgi:type IV pilus assembly protein PilA
LEGTIVKNIKRNVQQGFTLIELMIVIAIVAILVALAVPAYQDYTVRAKVGECVNAAAVPKLSISEYYETVGSFPSSIGLAGMTNQGVSQYCTEYGSGTYSGTGTAVTFDIVVDTNSTGVDCLGKSCTAIQPRMNGTPSGSGGVDWRCSRGQTDAADLKFLPSTCRGDNT